MITLIEKAVIITIFHGNFRARQISLKTFEIIQNFHFNCFRFIFFFVENRSYEREKGFPI